MPLGGHAPSLTMEKGTHRMALGRNGRSCACLVSSTRRAACAWPGLPGPGSILRRWLGLGANQGAPHPRTLTSPQALRNSRDTRADLSGIPRCPGELLPFRVGSDSPEHPCPRSPTAGLSLLAVPVPIARSTRCDMVVRPSQRLEPPIGLVSRPLRPHGPEHSLHLKVVAGQTFP